MRSLFVFALCLILAPASLAQSDRWQAFPSLRSAQVLAASDEALWVGTDGGVYSYAPGSGEIERFTLIEGLSGVDARALTYDPARDAVWIGYPDGVLDRIDVETGSITSFLEIARADRFSTRSINRIEVAGDTLRIATGFGLVIFDAERNEVRDTYERFGSLPLGTATFAVLEAPLPDGRAGLWVGTRGGVAYAPLDAPNLREPAAWTLDDDGPTNVLSLALFEGELFAGTEGGEEGGAFRRRVSGEWTPLPYGPFAIPAMTVEADRLVAISFFRIIVREPSGSTTRYTIDALSDFHDIIFGPGGRLWLADHFGGLVALPTLDGVPEGTIEPEQTVVPRGPDSNAIRSVAVGPERTIWTGFQPSQDREEVFAFLEGDRWTGYSVAAGDLDRRAHILEITSDEAGNVWLGSLGAGLYQVTPEGEVLRYDVENSSLAGSGGNEDYVVVPGLAVDDADNLWVTNQLANPPLHVRTPEGEWQALQRPSEVPSTVTYSRIYIDSFGQKWITARSSSAVLGTGLAVIDTGADPLDTSDDRAVYVGSVGSVGTGLPNTQVNAIVEDRSGRLWIGTDRGLATVFSPGSILSGNAASQITWTRTPDGTSFFLRDLRIFDIAVDPADRKWLASNSGVWLINAEGNEVIENFTSENSPLPSDAVVAVDIDETDGTVYFATDGGLYSYRGGAIAPVREAADLFVYPNPLRAEGGALPEVSITGLVDRADVRVLTVDGQVVAAFTTRGGSVQWDGRDQRTGDFVPSGVYIVAADGEGGTAYGKVAVIR